MISDTYKILKLISGESIICELSEDDGKYEISKPLLMNVHQKMTRKGMTESLELSRWVQPFTEQKSFAIDPKHVIIMLPASPGLSIFYEGVIYKIEDTEEISIVDNFKDDDMYDELLDELETDNKSIH
jgi:uncharacterized secreted protein with C-terminal beta-propeller domain